jgi:hypothetical protein
MSTSQSPTTSLSATAPTFDPHTSLKAELAVRQAELISLKASAHHTIRLALSEESSSDSMEEYLALKYEDRRQHRLISTQQSIVEEHEKQIQQRQEWVQIEEILRVGRVGFRREVESERSDAVAAMRRRMAEGVLRRE